MVSLSIVQSSNATIPQLLPPSLVAVFVGGTSGIGEATVKRFAKLAVKPRIYIAGRSREAAEHTIAECRTSNPDGEYIFIQKDMELMRNIDLVCDEIKSREKVINLLVISAGVSDLSRSSMERMCCLKEQKR
jgi:short-subunit dehydrogenase